jgi:hypothetical protein
LPAKESIREIRINQNPFSAEYDKLGYGRIEILTKPGAAKFHGSLGYNFADDFWNSRNPYAAGKAPLLLNEFENSVSGPLGKRASFTFDLERQMVDNGSITNAVIVDPQSLVATPFSDVLTTPQRRFRTGPRVDYQLSQNHTLSLRYTFDRRNVRDAGIGGFDLISRGYHVQNTFNTVQATETAVLGSAVNETRFQYYRWGRDSLANSTSPSILVLGAFNGGGAQTGHSSSLQNNFELQNYTSILHGRHSVRFGVRLRADTEQSASPRNFGGTFTFSSLESYRLTLLGAAGAGASQFSIAAGAPGIDGRQIDAGLFVGDDWRVKPNLTLSLGLRYETQTNIHDRRDLAPRMSLAWAPGGSKPKTVFRAGYGIFYDRFALADTLAARRHDGIVQQQYVIANPDFYPNIPSISAIVGARTLQVIERVDSSLRAPYIMQSALTVERQAPKNTTISVSYAHSRGVHTLRSTVTRAPGQDAPIFLRTSSGVFNQNQLIANVNTKLNSQVSLFGFYVLNQARSNSDGLSTFPANPNSDTGEYAPASTDVRQRFFVGGSVNTKWNIRLNPYIVAQSGAPFDITTGRDVYGTTLFNSRPGLATDPGRPGVVQTPYGLLDPDPAANEKILPRNYGRGPGQITVNLRLAKTIPFGRSRSEASGSTPAGAGPGVTAATLSAPGGMRGLFSPPAANRRYTLTISLSARNVLNHNNQGPITGNITSPLFGRSNQIAAGPNGEGFSENASNRRLELQIQFRF